MAEVTTEATVLVPQDVLDPVEIDAILNDLQGFGIADSDQLITMKVKGKTVSLRLRNLSVEDEIQGLIANLEIKGHVWVHQMRCDLLSRAVSWINGVKITEDLIATDPVTKEERPILGILRDMLHRWGQTAVLILFKVYMVHCQTVEDNLIDQLPDATIMTANEERFMRQIADEIKAKGVEAITDIAVSAMDSGDSEALEE